MQPIIILTSTVHVNFKNCCLVQIDKNERLETYMKSIVQWLNKTNFKIILVENSGYTFPELEEEKQKYSDRFEIITFNEEEVPEAKYLQYSNSKGARELFAINYAVRQSKIILEHTFIIKITARFFIPELETYFSSFNFDNFDCLKQNDSLRCEIVGCHVKHFSHVFDPLLKRLDGWVEREYDFRIAQYRNVLVCKKFQIKKTQRGGGAEFYTDI
jgi:hypothetical protein